MKKISYLNWHLAKQMSILFLSLLLLLMPTMAFAQNGTLSPQSGMPLYGNYCTVSGGIGLNDAPYSGNFSVNVPGTPVNAYWYWTGRDRAQMPTGDDTIFIDPNQAGFVQLTATQTMSSTEPSLWTWYTYLHEDLGASTVVSGTNSFDVGGLNISGINQENHGAGVIVVYESPNCPYGEVNVQSGLDSARFNKGGVFGPDTEVTCSTFAPSSVPRTMTVHMPVGGIAETDHSTNLWYQTGSGLEPTYLAPDANDNVNPASTLITSPVSAAQGFEWDMYTTTIQINPGDTHACFQYESISGSLVWAGLTTSLQLDQPSIDIEKTPDLQSILVGQPAIFTIRVQNTGDIALNNVTVTDALSPACDTNLGTMAAGEVQTYTCSLEAVPEGFTNVADVEGTPDNGIPVTDSDDADVIVLNPSINIEKTPDSQIVVIGETVPFTIYVENTGDITLTNVIVTDPLAPLCDASLGTLAPGENRTYGCSLPEGTVDFVNVAAVTGMPPVGDPVTDEDDAAVDVINPAIDIQKTPELQTVVAGSTVTFEIRVENIGDVMLGNVLVTDPLAPNCDANLGTMASGEVQTYACTLADVTADFTNIADVSGETVYGQIVTDEDDAVVDIIGPAIEIEKTPDVQTVRITSDVTFTIIVTNTGDVTLENVTVTDAMAPQCDADLGTMEPDATQSYSCVMPNALEDFVNVASVTGEPPTGPNVSDTDDATVNVINPLIEIEKSPDMQTVVTGTPITFTITVRNIGDSVLNNVALDNVAVIDELAPDCTRELGTLQPGDEITYTCSMIDGATEDFINIASVSGTSPLGETVTDEDDAVVDIIGPAIEIEKTPDMQTVVAGAPVTFTITVRNIGDISLNNVALDNVAVIDELAPDCNRELGTLQPNEETTYSCSMSEGATENFTNVATVAGDPPVGPSVSDEDDADVTVVRPSIDILKTPDLQTLRANTTAEFTIQVINTGDVLLNDVMVNDPLSPNCDASFDSLAPGAVETYTCTVDNVAEGFTNVADVQGMPPFGDPVTAEDDAVVDIINPSIDIQKTPEMQIFPVGGTALFTITVTNNGDEALNVVQVDDVLSPDCNRALGTMQPGEVKVYSCIQPTVMVDFTNVATVSGLPSVGTAVVDEDDANVDVISPSIDIEKSAEQPMVSLGDTAFFTITVTNTGDVALSAVTVSDPQAPGCSQILGTLESGETFAYRCGMPDMDSAVTNVASVIGTPAAGPNVQDIDDAFVDVPNADLQIVKTDDDIQTQPGSTIVYTLSYMNNGTGDAIGAVITEVIPQHTTFLPSASTDGWICTNGAVTAGTTCIYEIGRIAAGRTIENELKFAVVVDSVLDSSIRLINNQVSIDASNNIPVSGTNVDTETTPIAPTALNTVAEPEAQFTNFLFLPLVNGQ